jgi:regulator of protease activity HflC (stomatin/prohibitin superfamily)
MTAEQRSRRTVHPSEAAQRGQLHPDGQRKAAKYLAQASSLEKRFSNSSNVLG